MTVLNLLQSSRKLSREMISSSNDMSNEELHRSPVLGIRADVQKRYALLPPLSCGRFGTYGLDVHYRVPDGRASIRRKSAGKLSPAARAGLPGESMEGPMLKCVSGQFGALTPDDGPVLISPLAGPCQMRVAFSRLHDPIGCKLRNIGRRGPQPLRSGCGEQSCRFTPAAVPSRNRPPLAETPETPPLSPRPGPDCWRASRCWRAPGKPPRP